MKKKFTYLILFFLLAGSSAFVIVKFSGKEDQKTKLYSLLPRQSALAYSNEWPEIKSKAELLLRNIAMNPSDIKSKLALTSIYLQEARVTGRLDYYNMAALSLVNEVIAQDAENFEALTFKSMVLLSQHKFEEGLAVAEKTRIKYPYNAFIHGLIVDANVELGNYKEALVAADQMVSIRPDIRSYSRIAYLREIFGDLEGAVEAMNMAVDAGSPGDENTEWCRVQLGKIYEKLGKVKEANMQYAIALQNRENYPYALVGLAGLAINEKKYDEALALYLRADSIIPDHTFKEGIAEAYTLLGKKDKAKKIADEVLAHMKMLSESGQNEDHELAHAYTAVGKYDVALAYALKEQQRRPENIEANETVAMVYFEKGEYSKALPYIKTALKTNCKNPELLELAEGIFEKTGTAKKAGR